MSVFSYPLARRRTRTHQKRGVSRRFDSAGPFTYLFLLLVLALSIFPIYWSLVVASQTDSAIGAYPPIVTPGSHLFENLGKVFDPNQVNVNFLKAMLNSAIVASVVTVSVVFFSALAGFAFAKLHFRGSNVLLLVVIATTLVPVQLGVIPLYIEMIHFHWLNSLKAVIAPNLATAFGVFLMRQYISEGVPNELIDSARVDGAHTLRVFWHVILPAVRPVAAVLGLLTFMNTWNDFFWPLVVLNHNPTVQVAVSTVAGVNFIPDFSLILAATFMAILPLLFVFLVLGKQIIGGIMQGAVKG